MVTPVTQLSFDELDDPLREISFVVLDLETTGGSARNDAITEIGAVKVRGGLEEGSFATLINPGRSIPPQITMLTGISDLTVAQAPLLDTVLPSLLEFLRGSVLVAHNAPFDVGFLRAACAAHNLPWPNPPVVDTVRLARRVLPRSQAPSVRLGVLAPLLGSQVVPDHRALTDARATVDVLHALLERLGPLGVQSLPELLDFCRGASTERRHKRHLAADLPESPGVYLFHGAKDEVLYVGTSVNIRRRVRSYFAGAQQRDRIRQMVQMAERVQAVECAHALEANIREQRLIAAHRPPYNRRSKAPRKLCWVTLTAEPYPRLSVVSAVPAHGRVAIGPFTSRSQAAEAMEALWTVLPIRRCTQRLRRNPQGSACALAELGHCQAPCSGAQTEADYRLITDQLMPLCTGADDHLLHEMRVRMEQAATAGRFDLACTIRDRLAALVDGLDRYQRLIALAEVAEMVAAQHRADGGWDLAVIRHGYLAGSGRSRPGANPWQAVQDVLATACHLPAGAGALTAATAEETTTILRWLETDSVRLAASSQPWASPVAGAGRWRQLAVTALAAKGALRSADLRDRLLG